jgi:hypothetical protein
MAKKGEYKKWLTEGGLKQLEEWARLGLTDKEIANNIGVVADTLSNWKTKYEPIKSAIKKGRAPVVIEIMNAMVKRATGYEYEESDTYFEEQADGSMKPRVVKKKRHLPPDVGAGSFLLKNWAPEQFRRMSPEFKAKIEAETENLRIETAHKKRELEDGNGNDEKIIIVNNADDERMKKWVEENGGL